MRCLYLFATVVLFTISSFSLASATIIAADKDAYIQSGTFAASNFGNDFENRIKRDDNSNWNRKSYFGFDLSALPSAPIATATFSLDFIDTGAGTTSSTTSYEFELFGLTDQSLDMWGETSITWNNAPANQANNSLDLSKVTSLGTFSLLGKGVGGYDFSSQLLVDFLNSDSNDFATLIVRRNTDLLNGYTYVHAAASRENTAASGPELTVTPVPEPSTLLLLGAGLVGLGIIKRKRS